MSYVVNVNIDYGSISETSKPTLLTNNDEYERIESRFVTSAEVEFPSISKGPQCEKEDSSDNATGLKQIDDQLTLNKKGYLEIYRGSH